MKLIQKTFLEGTREFEIENDVVNVRIKKLFKEEKLTVGLSTLNPEPVINTLYLEFHGRGKSGPLLSLFLNKPDTEKFNTFVDRLKQGVLEQSNTFAGGKAVSQTPSQPAGLAANVYDEPPEFEEFGHNRLRNKGTIVNAARVEEAIRLLEMYLANEEIKPLLSALEALQAEPENETYFAQMENAFNNLGIMQGAVLTYAPYLSILLADDPFANN
ncbi:MAG: hypothetical protein P8Y24_07940 [Gammaproteobacteria bacterium]